jgi:hypothetical protein
VLDDVVAWLEGLDGAHEDGTCGSAREPATGALTGAVLSVLSFTLGDTKEQPLHDALLGNFAALCRRVKGLDAGQALVTSLRGVRGCSPAWRVLAAVLS